MQKRKSITGSIFMYLCTLLAVFITVSGIIMVQTIEGTILQILFLPITIYLVISSINQLFYKSPSSPYITLKTSRSFFVTALVIFFLLMFLGVRSIAKSQRLTEENITTIELNNTDNTAIVRTTEDDKSNILVIKADNPKAVISVRETPSESSPIIYQARVGQEYEYLKEEGGWYEVKVDEKTGWLKASYIEIKK